jgi:hypothetical protein
MKIHEIIVEAIPISKYRDVMKLAGNVDYKARYDELFGGKMRLYFPLELNPESLNVYKKELGHEELFANLLNNDGYSNVNFQTNTAVDIHGRTVKLGKAIEKAISQRKDRVSSETIEQYIRYFHAWSRENQKANKEMKAKTEKEKLMVVISRHPYDVTCMSTGRDWTSCMNINNGARARSVLIDIKHGTIIAYLVYAHDTNIQHPLGRVLIKPFFNDRKDSILFGIEKKTYPQSAQFIPRWEDIVQKWVDDANAKAKKGTYYLPDGMYDDSIPLEIEK